MQVTLETDPRRVKAVADHLTNAVNGYLKGHPGAQMPDVLMGLCHFWLSVISDQADRMTLSPEQRDSYYRTALSILLRLTEHDLEQIVAMRYVAATARKDKGGHP
jgi:hypothetical protein